MGESKGGVVNTTTGSLSWLRITCMAAGVIIAALLCFLWVAVCCAVLCSDHFHRLPPFACLDQPTSTLRFEHGQTRPAGGPTWLSTCQLQFPTKRKKRSA